MIQGGILRAAEARVRQTLHFFLSGEKDIENLEQLPNKVFSMKTSESSRYQCGLKQTLACNLLSSLASSALLALPASKHTEHISLQRPAKLHVLSVTSLCRSEDDSPSRIAHLITFEPFNDGRSTPPEDLPPWWPAPLIEDLKVSMAAEMVVRPLSLAALSSNVISIS